MTEGYTPIGHLDTSKQPRRKSDIFYKGEETMSEHHNAIKFIKIEGGKTEIHFNENKTEKTELCLMCVVCGKDMTFEIDGFSRYQIHPCKYCPHE